MPKKNRLLYFFLLLTALILVLIFSKMYNTVFVDELIYGRWIYKIIFDNIGYLFPVYVGKQPLFFWINAFIANLLRHIPYHVISILNVLKTTAIVNMLITVFGLSLFFNKKPLKMVIPITFILGPFFLIYFSIGTVENLIIPLAILYWYCLSKKNYAATILLGFLVALTKSNASSILVSSLLIFLVYLIRNGKKDFLPTMGLIFSHALFLFLNLYIAFHFGGAESNNVTSAYPTLKGLLNNTKNYLTYLPYFFSFSFLFIVLINIISYLKKKNFKNLIDNPVVQILAVNVIVNAGMLLLLDVYYPRYYLIFFLSLFVFLAVSIEKINLKPLILFIMLDLVFVFFPAQSYRWRIPEIDEVQHFDRSSVHVPYDFKRNVLDLNPKATFLINDDRYGANNLFFSLIPLSIKSRNFRIEIYEDIERMEKKSLCTKYPQRVVYIWRDFSVNRKKNILQGSLFKSYYPFDYNKYKEALIIYKIDCANL